VLPGSSASSVFLIGADGCSGSLAGVSNCSELRGGIAMSNESMSFIDLATGQAGQDVNLGLDVFAQYGYDNVSLGDPSSSLPSLGNTTVGIIASVDFWLGLFGMSPRVTNFSSFSAESFFAALRSDAWIASQTWAYTAGSVNRELVVLQI
jgi:hypothetical protein